MHNHIDWYNWEAFQREVFKVSSAHLTDIILNIFKDWLN